MSSHGKLGEFKPEEENISAYLERVQIYFQANDIKRERQVAVFFSVVGGKTYSLLRDLCAPSKPVEKSVEELSAVLRKHFDPKPLLIVAFTEEDRDPRRRSLSTWQN